MEINVIEDDRICNIQAAFREAYPFLKLIFYKNPHHKGEASLKGEQLDDFLPIEDVTMFHESGRIDIDPQRTVGQVEEDFFHKLGLCVQVMRLSGNTWLTTTDTDGWTLKAQNDKGKEHSLPVIQDKPTDFDLQDVD